MPMRRPSTALKAAEGQREQSRQSLIQNEKCEKRGQRFVCNSNAFTVLGERLVSTSEPRMLTANRNWKIPLKRQLRSNRIDPNSHDCCIQAVEVGLPN